ncbi:ABC transporter permease [Brachybacterium vulturis]|uniref:ABC transporter permease n=1 Tax=Brachybacterium vulturis TaxID=2017484 RepID=A0A291GR85_9MICO|nr:carbohydrate ABC transporter permease [Brachybacterium vulturis]ATG52506.1 ABC transporter permease [Brachybacterium vulturis]
MSVTPQDSVPAQKPPIAPPARERRPVRTDRPWKVKGAGGFGKPTLAGLITRYVLLLIMLMVAIGPFIWQLSTSLKGPRDDIYSFPPELIPGDLTLDNYARVAGTIPIIDYAWHSLIVAVTLAVANVVFGTLAGYALGCLRFRGKRLAMVILLSTLLLPGEVTLMSQFLTIKTLGLANTLGGVILPGLVGAINVLLMTAACRSIPKELIEAAVIDGASTWQILRNIVWPSVRGMASVVAIFAFIGGWDDFLWPLIVLTDPAKYTLTVGMEYLNSNFGSDPRVVAAGTMIALIPIIVFFAFFQKFFFRGVEDGAIKG